MKIQAERKKRNKNTEKGKGQGNKTKQTPFCARAVAVLFAV
jgi:hypothetical protein